MQTSKHDIPVSLAELTGDIKRYLSFLSGIGCKGFDCSGSSLKLIQEWGKPKRNQQRVKTQQVGPEVSLLDSVRSDVEKCNLCHLSKTHAAKVFGMGNPDARIMFIGDVPAGNPEHQDNPFAGEAGNLLVKMIQAMTLSPEEVYVCTIVKCRPSENRHPDHQEINACSGFLEQQIRAVNPDVVCALGAVAAKALIGKADGLSGMRGNFQEVRGMRLMPTFHPEFLIKHPEKKREAWEDLKKVMVALGLKPNT